MASRTLPGLGLTGYWDLGEDNWKDAMDANLRILSVVAGGLVKSRVTALPGSPTAGDIYIVPAAAGSNANEIAVYDGPSGSEAWVYITPMLGRTFYVEDEAASVQWDGTDWLILVPPTAGDSTVAEKIANYALAAGDFVGNKTITMNLAVANTVTVTAGLTVTEPVTVVQTGAGQTTFVADTGVTILTAETLNMRARYSSASLIPNGVNSYILVGDMELTA